MDSVLVSSVGKTSNIISKLVGGLVSAGSWNPDADLDAIVGSPAIREPRLGAILYALMLEPVFFHREEDGSITYALRPLRRISVGEVRRWLTRFDYVVGNIASAEAISKDDLKNYWRIQPATIREGWVVALDEERLVATPHGPEHDYIWFPAKGWYSKSRGVFQEITPKHFIVASRREEHVIRL